jgi:NTE family protein
VLEEYRVPIDCIAGTSMGSLVGAAYSSGKTTADMDNILASISTEMLVKDKPPRQERSMRRKADDYSILFSPELGVKNGKIDFAKGLVSGVQLENVLRKLTNLHGYHDFNRLPIPFRAIATDLVTGKAVVFDNGDLVNVMRASMSVPGAITPAEFDGKILVDGMLTSNLPVETALKVWQPDVIIAVNVGTPLLKREALNNILGVTSQMLSILTEQNVQTSMAKLRPQDILISPELGDYSTSDFDDLQKISPKGEEAARLVTDQLKKLSLPPEQYAALRRHQTTDFALDLAPVDDIRFAHMERVNPRMPRSVMETQPGKPIDQDQLDGDMRRIYGTGDFSHVSYRIVDEQGKRIMAVDAVEKSWGPDYLRFGLGLSSNFKGEAYYNLLASYRKTWLNALGAEWRNDVQVGQNSRLFSEFYQPLTAESTLFVAPSIEVGRRIQPVYSGNTKAAEYDLRTSQVNFDIGSQFYRYGEARLGVQTGSVRASLDTGSPALVPPNERIDTGGMRAQIVFDQLDSTIFPRSGWTAVAYAYDARKGLGADDEYSKWLVTGSFVESFGEHTFNFYTRMGGSLGNSPIPAYDQFQWGGFLQQSGYATGQLTAQDIRYGRMMYYRRILRGKLLEGAYAGLSLEVGKMNSPLVPNAPTDWITSGSVFIGSDTPIGPAYIGYGYASEGVGSFYFFLGKPY